MGRKKTLAIVVLLFMIPGYMSVVTSLPPTTSQECQTNDQVRTGAGNEQVGFCSEIGVSVSRSYYFGLIRLPVQRMGFNFDLLNKTFLPVLLGLSILLWRR